MNKTPHYEEISHSILIRQLLLGGPAVTKYVPWITYNSIKTVLQPSG